MVFLVRQRRPVLQHPLYLTLASLLRVVRSLFPHHIVLFHSLIHKLTDQEAETQEERLAVVMEWVVGWVWEEGQEWDQ